MKTIPLKSIRNGTPSVKAYIRSVKDGQHVVPSKEGWKVKKANSKKSTKIFSTQKEAITYAREIAINQQKELLLHGSSGQIRAKNSYGNDSFPPRG